MANFDQLKKRLGQVIKDSTDAESRLSQLKKLDDANEYEQRKNAILGSRNKTDGRDARSDSALGSDYQLLHLLIVAILSLIIGALMAKSEQGSSFMDGLFVGKGSAQDADL